MNQKHFQNLQKLAGISIVLAFLISCNKDDDQGFTITDPIAISTKTSDTIIHIPVGNSRVPIYLAIPPNPSSAMKAVMVLHGSGGLWKDNDPEKGVLGSQFEDWKELINQNGMVAVFPDSYSPRGCEERTGKWKVPPDRWLISSQWVRPQDAFNALTMLRNLQFKDSNAVIHPQKVGLLGFSDGGTALAATQFDHDAIPEEWDWTQKFGGKTYGISDGVLPPPPPPKEGGFNRSIFYYGGAFGNGFWGGNPCSDDAAKEYIYNTNKPMLCILGEEDSLTENALCMVSQLQEKGSPVQLEVYQNVGHGFDTDELPQSADARKETINFLKKM
ncbi:MAG: dienelactone hydrolase family protein [Bacteroidota bacterium]